MTNPTTLREEWLRFYATDCDRGDGKAHSPNQKEIADWWLSKFDSILEGIIPEEMKLPKRKCINAENHIFGSCFQCERIKGFNACRDELLKRIKLIKNI